MVMSVLLRAEGTLLMVDTEKFINKKSLNFTLKVFHIDFQ